MATVQQMGKTVQQNLENCPTNPICWTIFIENVVQQTRFWRSVVQQALERRETVQQISECLMSRPQGSGKGGGLPTGGTYGVCHLLIGKGGAPERGGAPLSLKEIEGGPHFP